ncbi:MULTISPECIES: alpha/beta fold hydrolase [Calothrix]|uniref:Alpha/beta fold hydrolase n=2 Tax=Calothrix TaxID=1186 RepID=A0ABR8ALZ9_9CYAN|nr:MULTISPECIES: alpha/beta fold hydrolase [Calothrix]MBD2200654.1 alpha/beta fold hydrolase [Calothrix parietina FACHB-288]MBD2229697.1 alpha/beta fold hydrolase [Calothrix anomala FACHB-343]
MGHEKQQIDVGGLNIRYLTAGDTELPLVLLHGVGDSAVDWSWVVSTLGTRHRVIAPDFPGSGDSAKPQREYSREFLTQFLADFLNTLEIQRAVLVGNSLGGLIALHYALSNPERVAGLVLVDSMGFSQLVNPALSNLTIPWYGELAIAWSKTPLGAKQRAWSRAALLFAHPSKVPSTWIAEQERLGLVPGFLEANLSILRSQVSVVGQRQIILDSLPQIQMPTLVVWGTNDYVLPNYQAQDAVKRLQQGHLALIPDCGHLPQVERPELFTDAVNHFLASVL